MVACLTSQIGTMTLRLGESPKTGSWLILSDCFMYIILNFYDAH